jgi:hypothetical protein
MYHVEQYVVVYSGDQEKIAALLPEGYESSDNVLRIEVEVVNDLDGMEGEQIFIEVNTPVEGEDGPEWLELVSWESMWTDIFGMTDGTFTRFTADFDGTEFLDITFTENDGECDCQFRWQDPENDYFSDKPEIAVPVMAVEPEEILDAYVMVFESEDEE